MPVGELHQDMEKYRQLLNLQFHFAKLLHARKFKYKLDKNNLNLFSPLYV